MSKGFRAMTKNGCPRSVTDIILDELGFNVTTTAKIVNYNVMFFRFVDDLFNMAQFQTMNGFVVSSSQTFNHAKESI